MSDYPKQMRSKNAGQVVTVFAAPDASGAVPVLWPHGHYAVIQYARLSPLPSPDDIVQVTVEMTRAQRDDWCEVFGPTPAGVLLRDACRAHRDAEEAP